MLNQSGAKNPCTISLRKEKRDEKPETYLTQFCKKKILIGKR